MKLVINKCYGGFGLSGEAFSELRKMGVREALDEPDFGEYYPDGSGPRDKWTVSFLREINRDNPSLIEVVQKLGEAANARCSKLEIIEVPDGVDWEVEEYDGMEWVAEKHRTWG